LPGWLSGDTVCTTGEAENWLCLKTKPCLSTVFVSIEPYQPAGLSVETLIQIDLREQLGLSALLKGKLTDVPRNQCSPASYFSAYDYLFKAMCIEFGAARLWQCLYCIFLSMWWQVA
jgi:hypothetical protein